MNRLLQLNNSVNSGQSKSQPPVKVILEKRGETATIWFSSPEDSNTISYHLVTQLLSSLITLNNDSETKIIVLRSKVNMIFSAGGDIKHFANSFEEVSTLVANFEKIRHVIRGVRKPIVSVVEGYALGGGFEIALLSDIIVCSEDAVFGLPEIKIGIMPGMGGTQTLARLVKEKIANRMIMTGGNIDAYEAERRNIAFLIKRDKFEQELQEFIGKIVNRASESLFLVKKVVRLSQQTSMEEGLVHEADMYPSLMGKAGPMEGVTAFIEKRPANFKGI